MFHAVVILLSHNDCFMRSRSALTVCTLPGEFLNPDFWLRSTSGYYSFNNHVGFEHFVPCFWEQGHVMCVCWACDVLSEAFAGVYNCWLAGDRNAIGALAFSSSLIFISSRCQKTWMLWAVMQSRRAALSMIGWYLNGCIIDTLHLCSILNARMWNWMIHLVATTH